LPLRLTNTLTRRLEPFEPIEPGRVSIYCCGITVYDLCHLGHARSYIVWDVLRRYLVWRGYAVTYVQNVTDIDDKILRRAASEGRTMEEVSEENLRLALEDLGRLNILPPDRMPRATRCLDGIRRLIGDLQAKGMAYGADGDVYFSVMGYPPYGKLSGRDLEQQEEGASGRVSADEEARKRHPFDFALWKGAKPEEPSFPSPWGPGRPGWHIECSAMVRQELGDTIDLHLGGADLIFPHHENEIAQSEAASGKPLAHYWLHNGMVNVGGEKMSKSLGNFTTIRSLLASGVSAMTLRFFVLQAHYRKPLDFVATALEAAATGWKGLNAALTLGDRHGAALGWSPAASPPWTTTSTPPRRWGSSLSWPAPCGPWPTNCRSTRLPPQPSANWSPAGGHWWSWRGCWGWRRRPRAPRRRRTGSAPRRSRPWWSGGRRPRGPAISPKPIGSGPSCGSGGWSWWISPGG